MSRRPRSRSGILLSSLKPYRLRLVLVFFLTAFSAALNLAFPAALKILLDHLIAGVLPGIWIFLAVSLAVCLRTGFGFGRSALSHSLSERAAADIRRKFHERALQTPVYAVEARPLGEWSARFMGDIDSVRQFLFQGVFEGTNAFFGALFTMAALFWIDPVPALVLTLVFIFWAWGLARSGQSLKRNHQALREAYGRLSAAFLGALRGLRTVQAHSSGDEISKRFSREQDNASRIFIKTGSDETALWAAADFFSSLALLGVLAFGAWKVGEGKLTPGLLVAFYSCAALLFMPLVRLSGIVGYYREAAAACRRLEDVLGPPLQPVLDGAKKMRLAGQIRFENVGFRYPGGETVLSGIDLEIKAGERVAIVGPSGSGKSTLAALLVRLFDPTAGTICIDGQALNSFFLADYRKQVGVVLQNDYIFDASVNENIVGVSDQDSGKIAEAARVACADEFIERLPLGYQTLLQENGSRLSQGQKQRLALARLVYKKPQILILDEATSAVDVETEMRIHQNLQQALPGRSWIVITHRLSAVRDFDRILFLENGRLRERGLTEELALR